MNSLKNSTSRGDATQLLKALLLVGFLFAGFGGCSSEAPDPVRLNNQSTGGATTSGGSTTDTTVTSATGTTDTTTGGAVVTTTDTTTVSSDTSGSTTTSTTGASADVTSGTESTTTATSAGGATSTTSTVDTTTATTGDGGTGGTMNSVDPMTYAEDMNGYTLFTNCNGNTTQVCRPATGQCDNGTCPANCPDDSDPALKGTTQHQTVIFGADAPAGSMWNVTFRSQGVVEAKRYSGGSDQDSGTQIPADGFYTGGIPDNSDGYNVYMIRVDCPSDACDQDYFLNSIGIPGDTRIRHAVFEVDFMATIPIEAGATVHFVSADNNCSAIDNCGDNPPGGTGCPEPTTFDGLDPAIAANVGSQPYDGQFVGIVIDSVTAQ